MLVSAIQQCESAIGIHVFPPSWNVRISSQSILKKINLNIHGRTVAKAEAPILWPLDVKRWLTGEDSDAGKNWRQRRKWQQGIRWLERVTESMDMNLSKLCELVEYRGTWCTTVHEVENSWIRLSNWMTTSTNTQTYGKIELKTQQSQLYKSN